MKLYPITDHIPESDILAITPDGAARWLERHGWTRCEGRAWWCAPGNTEPDVFMPSIWPGAGIGAYTFEHGMKQLVTVLSDVARRHGRGPREIIAEMQGDSRIMAALRASAVSKPETTDP